MKNEGILIGLAAVVGVGAIYVLTKKPAGSPGGGNASDIIQANGTTTVTRAQWVVALLTCPSVLASTNGAQLKLATNAQIADLVTITQNVCDLNLQSPAASAAIYATL